MFISFAQFCARVKVQGFNDPGRLFLMNLVSRAKQPFACFLQISL